MHQRILVTHLDVKLPRAIGASRERDGSPAFDRAFKKGTTDKREERKDTAA
jgi:hypothetical protein